MRLGLSCFHGAVPRLQGPGPRSLLLHTPQSQLLISSVPPILSSPLTLAHTTVMLS